MKCCNDHTNCLVFMALVEDIMEVLFPKFWVVDPAIPRVAMSSISSFRRGASLPMGDASVKWNKRQHNSERSALSLLLGPRGYLKIS